MHFRMSTRVPTLEWPTMKTAQTKNGTPVDAMSYYHIKIGNRPTLNSMMSKLNSHIDVSEEML